MIEITKVRVRTALPVRKEPYWGPAIAKGCVVGYRKLNATAGTWIARRRDDSGRKQYNALGLVTDAFGYEDARAAALKWIEAQDAGVTSDVVTVADACREYVEDRQRDKGTATAHDAQKRFERTVYRAALGRMRLDKVRTPHVKAWRDSLGLSKASANRTLTALKAALNLAVANRRVQSAAAREWGDVKAHANATRRRDLYLDREQRRALIECADGAVKDLMLSAALTGARAGELTSATRAQFDTRTGSITFRGKTGTRTVPLSDAALAHFRKLAQSKLPGALLHVRDDGRPWAHSDWDELVREAAAKAGLPKGVCLYTLRHSFITTAISDGRLPTLDVARLTGTSVTMIEKFYGHLVASAARERLARVEIL